LTLKKVGVNLKTLSTSRVLYRKTHILRKYPHFFKVDKQILRIFLILVKYLTKMRRFFELNNHSIFKIFL